MRAAVLAAIGTCLLSCAPKLHAGQLDVVSVTATGFGTSAAAATVDAVRNGVASVNGERIESTERVRKYSTSATGVDTQSSRTIDEDIRRTTNGVVKSWRAVDAARRRRLPGDGAGRRCRAQAVRADESHQNRGSSIARTGRFQHRGAGRWHRDRSCRKPQVRHSRPATDASHRSADGADSRWARRSRISRGFLRASHRTFSPSSRRERERHRARARRRFARSFRSSIIRVGRSSSPSKNRSRSRLPTRT